MFVSQIPKLIWRPTRYGRWVSPVTVAYIPPLWPLKLTDGYVFNTKKHCCSRGKKASGIASTPSIVTLKIHSHRYLKFYCYTFLQMEKCSFLKYFFGKMYILAQRAESSLWIFRCVYFNSLGWKWMGVDLEFLSIFLCLSLFLFLTLFLSFFLLFSLSLSPFLSFFHPEINSEAEFSIFFLHVCKWAQCYELWKWIAC